LKRERAASTPLGERKIKGSKRAFQKKKGRAAVAAEGRGKNPVQQEF